MGPKILKGRRQNTPKCCLDQGLIHFFLDFRGAFTVLAPVSLVVLLGVPLRAQAAGRDKLSSAPSFQDRQLFTSDGRSHIQPLGIFILILRRMT